MRPLLDWSFISLEWVDRIFYKGESLVGLFSFAYRVIQEESRYIWRIWLEFSSSPDAFSSPLFLVLELCPTLFDWRLVSPLLLLLFVCLGLSSSILLLLSSLFYPLLFVVWLLFSPLSPPCFSSLSLPFSSLRLLEFLPPSSLLVLYSGLNYHYFLRPRRFLNCHLHHIGY